MVGWGKTEMDAISPSQRHNQNGPERVTVVSESTCLRSDKIFRDLTSARTFCAGDKTGQMNPCNGDSGGGFIVESENRWYLRFIISASFLDQMPTRHLRL